MACDPRGSAGSAAVTVVTRGKMWGGALRSDSGARKLGPCEG